MTMRKLISGVLESISSGFAGPVNFLISYTSGKFHAANSQGESYTEIDPSVFDTSNINDIGYGPDLTNPTSTTSVAWTTITSPLWFEGNLAGGGSAPRRAIEFANNTWVMGGYRQSATLFTSTDAITWTTRNSGGAFSEWYDVAYGNGLWVIVGNAARLRTSTDTITWASRTSGFPNTIIYEVAYGNSIWTAVAGYGRIRTSTDGVTWTQQTSNFSNSAFALTVAYSNGMWVVGGSGGGLQTSTNAITWVSRNSNFGNTSIAVVRNINGIWLMGGSNNTIRTSTDTITWTTVTNSSAASDTLYRQFKYDSIVQYLAFGSSGANQRIFRSTDLISWVTIGTIPELGYLQNAANNGNRYVITHNNGGNNQNVIGNIMDISTINIYPNNTFLAAANSGKLAQSTNGLTWITRTSNITNSITSAVSGNNIWLIGSLNELRSSTDGVTWITRISNFTSNQSIAGLAYANGAWIAGSSDGSLRNSTDGIAWTTLNPQFFAPLVTWTTQTSNFGIQAIFGAVHGNGFWTIAGTGGQIRTSTNAITWVTRNSNFGNTNILAIAYGNGIWVAVGGGASQPTGQIRRSTDTITWITSTIPSLGSLNNLWYDVAYGNGLWVAVSGDPGINNNRAARSTDGITWTTATPSGVAGNQMRAVAYGNGAWVITSFGGIMHRSTDALTWISATFSLGGSINSIAYANGIWLAGGNNGALGTATDGLTWTTRNGFFGTTHIKSVSYGNNIWVAVGYNGELRTSTNTINWTTRTSNFGSTRIDRVAYGNGLWIIGGLQGQLRTSSQSVSTPTSISKVVNISTTRYGFISSGKLYEIINSTTVYDADILWTTQNINNVALSNGKTLYLFNSGQLQVDSTTVNTGINDNFINGAQKSDIYNILGHNAIYRSTNLVNWTTISTPIPVQNDIVNSALTWTTRNINTTEEVKGSAYGNGTWLITGMYREARTSTDTVTWTTRTISSNSNHSSFRVAYGNSLWVAAGRYFSDYGLVFSSTDAITWTTRFYHSMNRSPYNDVAYGNGRWLAGAGGQFYSSSQNSLVTSTNGISWSYVNSGTLQQIWRIAYGGGTWLITGLNGFIGAAGTEIRTSTDTVTWITRTSNFGNTYINAIAYGGGLWVAAGNYGQLRTSTDTITWTTRESNFGSSLIRTVGYDAGVWFIGGDAGNSRKSTDGITWATLSTNFSPSRSINVSTYGNSLWLIAGAYGQVRTSPQVLYTSDIIAV